jgi:hypothetical protein
MEYCKNCKKKTQHYFKYMHEYILDTRAEIVCDVCGWCLDTDKFWKDLPSLKRKGSEI